VPSPRPITVTTVYIPHPTPYTLHPTPYTLHPTPCTLHPAPFIPHPTPHTLHPIAQTLHTRRCRPRRARAAPPHASRSRPAAPGSSGARLCRPGLACTFFVGFEISYAITILRKIRCCVVKQCIYLKIASIYSTIARFENATGRARIERGALVSPGSCLYWGSIFLE
jgi:hypothetical protein